LSSCGQQVDARRPRKIDERGEITKRLIAEKGFTAVVVDADWPDAYRVNRYGVGDPFPTKA